MKNLIQLEEAAMFAFSILLFSDLSFAWWWFLALILAPDIGMIGYAFGNKIGAYTYNLFHHKGIAVVVYAFGWWLSNDYLMLSGIILFGHASIDRLFGYGLKYEKGFKFTHLGEIGK
ncbi:DUF4260 domain-containing protein [Marivirga sp.]|uniref:DUF4260 domain-containing protein n=1 Tax=Marivirga sp. TaxID=2018662 RepID=UPI002D7F6C4A|nr:DUF4260 domain-containing protein [Marivirga sp.]HET8860029.1 DUF4260 domain-containing protein [Marivirga sp.]